MLKPGEPFAMAGICGREPTSFETAEKNPVNFAIVTTTASDAVSYIRERMPVILPPRQVLTQADIHSTYSNLT
jgi:putative SOS response-associated peptidase YedK